MTRLAVACLALALSASYAAADVDVRKNITYYTGEGADRYRHRLDLYLPKGHSARLPVLIFVHGGGWTTGIKEQYAPIGDFFASHGIATAVINYRLSPKVEHPGHVQDVARAFAWVKAHIAEYGGRPDDIFVCGHSAGGHLVALLATNNVYIEGVGASLDDIKGAIPISAPYNPSPRSALFGRAPSADADAARDASPLAHVAGRRPPFLILYGAGDAGTTRDGAQRMARVLEAAGNQPEIQELANHNHMQMVLDLVVDGDPGARAILNFIQRYS